MFDVLFIIDSTTSYRQNERYYLFYFLPQNLYKAMVFYKRNRKNFFSIKKWLFVEIVLSRFIKAFYDLSCLEKFLLISYTNKFSKLSI